MDKFNYFPDFRQSVSDHAIDSSFFCEVHDLLMTNLKNRLKYNFNKDVDISLLYSIQPEVENCPKDKFQGIKLNFFKKSIEKVDLQSFTNHIKLYNYFDSLELYENWIYNATDVLFQQYIHRISIIIEQQNRFYQREKDELNDNSKITYTHLFASDGVKYIEYYFEPITNIHLSSINFRTGFVWDEMLIFTKTINFRLDKLKELFTKSNPLSLKRKKNIIENELTLLYELQQQLNEEFPKSLIDNLTFLHEKLEKLNLSIENRKQSNKENSPGGKNWHHISPIKLKKCYKELRVSVIDSSPQNFINVFQNGIEKINWTGHMNQLLYFSKCLKELKIIKSNNLLFIYDFFTLNGDAIIEQPSHNSNLSKRIKEDNFINKNSFIKKASSYLTDN